MLISTSGIRSKSRIHVRVKGIVPFSKAMASKRTVMGRTSLAKRSIPIHGMPSNIMCTKAIIRRNRVAVHIERMGKSDGCRGVVTVVRRSRGLGSSLRKGTRRLTSGLIPCAFLKAKLM